MTTDPRDEAARVEADVRWPLGPGSLEVTYPVEALRTYMRSAFVAGSAWQREQGAVDVEAVARVLREHRLDESDQSLWLRCQGCGAMLPFERDFEEHVAEQIAALAPAAPQVVENGGV